MLTRRQLLQYLPTLTALAASPALLTRCANPALGPATDTDTPFALWEALRTVARGSQDHLPARLAAASEARDWRAIYRIVRDGFVTLPGGNVRYPFVLSEESWRAGPYACERAGAGTPLEQCLVLQSYLQQAGFGAQLYTRRQDLSMADFYTQLTRNTPPEYDAELPEELAGRLASLTGDPLPVAGSDPGAPDKLRESVLAALPATDANVPTHVRGGNTPILIVTAGDGVRYALPLVGPQREPIALPPGEPEGYRTAEVPEEALSVRASISARFRGVSDEKVLLEHDFPASTIAGRHLNVLFDPGVPIEALASLPVGSMTAFTPVLELARLPDDPLYRPEEEAIVGEAFTVFDDAIEKGPHGATVNGVTPHPQPERARRVTDVRLTAQAFNFPEVELQIWAYGADGEPVEGLSSADITITENGRPMPATLRRNLARPHVVVLFDTTRSMPAEYRTQDFMAGFQTEIERLVRQTRPTAEVSFREGDDRYYDNLTEQVNRAPDLIVCFSDGRIIGEREPRHEAALATLPPLVFIHAIPEVHPDLETLAEYIAVAPVAASDRLAIANEIGSLLREVAPAPYLLSYYGQAAEDGPTPVTASISDIAATDEYVVFPGGSAPLLEGLYLDLSVGNDSHRFTLGGYDARLQDQAKEAAAIDAHDALFGSTSVYIEGAGMTPAVLLDDLLGGRLTARAMLEVDDPTEKFEAFQQAMTEVTSKDLHCLSLLQSLPGTVSATGLTYPDGLRICIRQRKVLTASGALETRVSLAPTAHWTTATPNANKAFRQTFAISWQLARAEAALYQQSTVGYLEGQPLTEFHGTYAALAKTDENWSEGSAEIRRTLRAYGDTATYSYAVVSRAAPAPVWFSVSRTTGEVIGILPDLTGGGRSKGKRLQRIKKADVSLQIFINAASTTGLIPMGAYFAVVAKWYMIATTHLITLDASMDSRCEIMKILQGAAMDAVIGGLVGAYVPRPIAVVHSHIAAGGAEVNLSNYTMDDCAGFPSQWRSKS